MIECQAFVGAQGETEYYISASIDKDTQSVRVDSNGARSVLNAQHVCTMDTSFGVLHGALFAVSAKLSSMTRNKIYIQTRLTWQSMMQDIRMQRLLDVHLGPAMIDATTTAATAEVQQTTDAQDSAVESHAADAKKRKRRHDSAHLPVLHTELGVMYTPGDTIESIVRAVRSTHGEDGPGLRQVLLKVKESMCDAGYGRRKIRRAFVQNIDTGTVAEPLCILADMLAFANIANVAKPLLGNG